MPKLILASNVVLLFALSMLSCAALLDLIGGANVSAHCVVGAASVVAWVTAGIMAVTEIFSGIRSLPVITIGCLIVGSVVADATEPSLTAAIAWTVGWVSVALWFAVLAFRERENR